MKDNIFEILENKYNTFSKTFKHISDYVRDNYSDISFMSIKEFSEEVGVSPASITRFTQEIGFGGYPAFQRKIQELLQNEIGAMREIKNSISEKIHEDDLLKKTIELNIRNIENTYSDVTNNSFKNAIDILSKARQIYIIGLRSSYCVAYYLYFMLNQFMDNVILLSPGTGDIFDRIYSIDKSDVLFAIGFQRYTKLTLQIIEFFEKHMSPIIALTDKVSSPIAVKSNTLLIAKNSSTTYSFVSAMTILNALIIGMGKRNAQDTLSSLKEKEKIAVENGIYWTPEYKK